MAMSHTPHDPGSVTLSLPPAEQWTLHHVLLDRIEQEVSAEDATSVEPPSAEVYQAFETLNAGGTSVTIAQLKAMQTLLAEYHHAPSWEHDRPRLEQILHRIAEAIEQHERTPPAD